MHLIMWLLAVALGAVVGYSLSQRGSRIYWQRELEQQQAALRAELDAIKQQVQNLRQDNADLRYQLGEQEKARRYAENRGAENRGKSD
jgi:cell division protein FtsB